MTVKKMADIFFKKFSELISTKSDLEKTEKVFEPAIPHEKKFLNKILILSLVIIIVGIIIYSLSWITYK